MVVETRAGKRTKMLSNPEETRETSASAAREAPTSLQDTGSEPARAAPAAAPPTPPPPRTEQPPPPCPPPCPPPAAPRAPRTSSIASSRSSATVLARQLQAQAQHARRLADMERANEQRTIEREKKIADMELQAELAAIEAASSRRSSSHNKVQDWLEQSGDRGDVHDLPFENNARKVKTMPKPTVVCEYSRTPEKEEEPRLVKSLETLINRINSSFHSHPRTPPKAELPSFDGRSHLDWLCLKRVFENSADSYTDVENLSRLSCALRGRAREAVAALLVTSRAPGAVLRALDLRFGRPELVVLEEVTAVRALPRLTGINSKELAVFASRVSNCVEVVRLLNQTEYLSSPELFQALLSKLPPLLRTRWLDYASVNGNKGRKAKIEMLVDFLSREVELQCKFGLTSDNLPPMRDKIHTIHEGEQAHNIHESSSPTSKSSDPDKKVCLLCKQSHALTNCQKFLKLSVTDRWTFIKKNKICHRCLKVGWHKNRGSCNKIVCNVSGCNFKHHTLLHREYERTVAAHVGAEHDEPVPSTSDEPAPSTSSQPLSEEFDQRDSEVVTHAAALSTLQEQAKDLRPLLKIVAVTLSGPKGCLHTYALLDDGSTTTFIDSDIAKKIGAVGPQKHIHLECVGGLSKEVDIQCVDFSIQGRYSREAYTIKGAKSIKGLNVARQSFNMDCVAKYPYLSDVADELCYGHVQPTVIIGIDNWLLSWSTQTLRGTKSQPAASLTALGWVLYGLTSNSTKPVALVNHTSIQDFDKLELERLIKQQYAIESIGISKHPAKRADDERSIQILERTARRLPSGRFEVGLLWKGDSGMVIPESRSLAFSRFTSLEKKMSCDASYAQRYRNNINDMLSKGYAELCPADTNVGKTWYLPHFGVINPNKPLKLRVVHDAAAKSNGVSLNSLLLTGPDLLQFLLGILFRFREGKVAMTGDIREMFPQIKIIEEDRGAQRFLWRENRNEPIRTYRMSSMIFGAASSPFTALYIKNKNAMEHQDRFPDAVQAIINDHYMDDFLGSVDCPNRAAQLAFDVFTIHGKAGFEMRGWVSNHPSALSLLPKNVLLDTPSQITLDLGHQAAPVRTLGLIWQPSSDQIGFNVGITKEKSLPDKLTKRIVLAAVMRIYDPLGVLAPIVIRGRIMFQEAWRKGLDWDQELSQNDTTEWRSWFEELLSVSKLNIPRRYNLSDLEVQGYELHVFSDASESAFAAVAYWRIIYTNGSFKLTLICSKVRVAPLTPVSIPRLELQGALIAARLAVTIRESHRMKPIKCSYWCDSMTVLGWLRSDARIFKPFVSHRVGEILELTNVNEWRWVPSNLNVADDATRKKYSGLTLQSRWISGPVFLMSSESEWPIEGQGNINSLGLDEIKPSFHHVNIITTSDLPSPLSANPHRFSSWLRMVRATAKAHRFIVLLRTKTLQRQGIDFNQVRFKGTLCTYQLTCASSPSNYDVNRCIDVGILTADDISLAELHIFRQSQIDSFQEDVLHLKNGTELPRNSRLLQLSPEISEDGLLRMKGRIHMNMQLKEPIILDGKHPAIRLLIKRFHRKAAHQYTEMIVNELRQQYWILSLRNAVRSVAHGCELCKMRRAKVFHPPMGNLPEARLSPNTRPFTFVGLDYFGPIQVSVGRRREKRYIALFTCLVVRAIHIEVVRGLTTDAAIMCLRRFIARRGTPSEIWSDNGTAFIGASRELKLLYRKEFSEFAANERINWRFIPPSAPFMGGSWERLIGSVKRALKITLKEQVPNEEVLLTLLHEAEAIINSRPLTHVSVDAGSEEALTPMHFIIGSSSGRSLPATLEDTDLTSRYRWRKAVRMSDHFWRRWMTEYLPTLAPRRGGGAIPVVAIGDVVVIADGNLPRGSWPKGRVHALFPGKDGVVRVADVSTSRGVLRRPLKKLVRI